MKWQAVKRGNKYVSAGFCEFETKPGDTVESYDGPQDNIVAEMRASKAKPLTVEALRAELVAKGVL